jgi:hypothetical protein
VVRASPGRRERSKGASRNTTSTSGHAARSFWTCVSSRLENTSPFHLEDEESGRSEAASPIPRTVGTRYHKNLGRGETVFAEEPCKRCAW